MTGTYCMWKRNFLMVDYAAFLRVYKQTKTELFIQETSAKISFRLTLKPYVVYIREQQACSQ